MLPILDRIKTKSSEFPKTMFFINLIYSKKRFLTLANKKKISDNIQSYNKKFQPVERLYLDFNKEIIITEDILKNVNFNYLICPFQKASNEQQPYLDISNKTYIILNGQIISSYRKRVLGNQDFTPYICKTDSLRYFHSGTIGKDQLKFPKFFDNFALEICADHLNNIIFKDHKFEDKDKLIPFFHVLQSDFINFNETPIKTGFVLHIDSFRDRCFVGFKSYDPNLKDFVIKNWKETFYTELKTFKYIGWNAIHTKDLMDDLGYKKLKK